MSQDPPGPKQRKPLWVRLAPVAVVVAAIAVAYALGLPKYFTFEALRENRDLLLGWVAAYGAWAVLAYGGIYAVSVALSLPGAVFLTLAGGFMFGTWAATIYTVIAATVGATAIFLIARTALGDSWRRRAGPALNKMEAGFKENAFSYLMVLRLIPLFPFWLVNLVPAFLGVPLGVYVLATVIGIIPGTFVFCLTGAGLGSVFDSGEAFSVASVLTPELIAALVGLAALSLLPVLYKRYKARRAVHPNGGE